jgi:hypothetical protein
MTKPDLPYSTRVLLVICDLLVTHHPRAMDDFKNYTGDVEFYFCVTKFSWSTRLINVSGVRPEKNKVTCS